MPSLPWAFRRRGRSLLLGLPGSGKSTALRRVAAFSAARPAWPLPLLVRLDHFARLLASRGDEDALLTAALADEPLGEREALREAAAQALAAGRAMLLLDALDECGRSVADVVSALDRIIGRLHPAVEVLLGTRDAAYAQASTLGFRELRLVGPKYPHETARAVLRHAAARRDIDPSAAEPWIDDRDS